MITSTLRINSDAVRRHSHTDGREYLIVESILIREGVLNGAFVPGEEIAHYYQSWAGRPVVLDHPQESGKYVSANDPNIDVAACPGKLYNIQFDSASAALKAQLWIDIEKAESIGPRAMSVLERFEQGLPVEVSTGYFADYEMTSGEFDGVEYDRITRNIIPDHLALLPDSIGACSWADGCGAPRVNQLDSTSAFISFYLDGQQAQQLAALSESFDQEPAALQYHITLAYLGETGEVAASENQLLESLAGFAKYSPIVRATANGIARFRGEETRDPLVALVDSTSLLEWRQSLVWWIEDVAYPVSSHAFTPHITLGYIDADDGVTFNAAPDIDLVFDRLALTYNGKITYFPLQGEPAELETLQEKKQSPQGHEQMIHPLKSLITNLMQHAKKIVTGDNDMNRQEAVAALTANGCKLSKQTLEKMDDDTLQTLAADYERLAADGEQEESQPPSEPDEQVPDGEARETEGDESEAPKKDENMPEWAKALAEKVDQIDSVLSGNAQREREEKIGQLLKTQTVFDREDLEAMPQSAIDKLVANQTRAKGDYSGRAAGAGMGAVNSSGWISWQDYVKRQNQEQEVQ